MPESAYFLSDYESDLFHGRYKDPGNPDEATWNQVFERVANTVAPSHELALQFFDMMSSGDVIPSSPQLWNYGADRRFPRNGSSCFTGRMGDTLKEFRQADSDAEDVYVASGGFGLLLNETRPRGTKIRHCSEGAMGSMCFGGPARRVEGTTGYITGSGRARGALMLQLSAWHPDVIEFILSKRPTSLGWLDDWPANARSQLGRYTEDQGCNTIIDLYSAELVFNKEWPTFNQLVEMANKRNAITAIGHLLSVGILADADGRLVPQVTDWNAGGSQREANRDWELPLQNCNMSVRVPDALMHAVEADEPWVFHWYSTDPPKSDEVPWTHTDALDGTLQDYGDGTVFLTSEDMTSVEVTNIEEMDDLHYRYGVVITTWEGMLANLAPNQNQWRDTDYARFFRKVVQPALSKYKGRIMARQVWDLINDNAWNHADPGIVFEDTYERFQPVDSAVYGPRLSNPCSEYVNSAGGSCNLASVNLRACAEDANDILKIQSVINQDNRWMIEGTNDWKSVVNGTAFARYLGGIERRARAGIEYIGWALEYNEAPVEYIDEMTRDHFRTVGIGMMGLAEALMKFHVTYGSDCAVNFAAASMSEIALTSWEGSFKLASEGFRKPKAWDQRRMIDIFTERLKAAQRYKLPVAHLSRWRHLIARVARGEYATHTCVTSVAPTGSISMVASWAMTRKASNGVINHRTVSGGLEPPFYWGVKRQDSSGNDEQFHDLWYMTEHHDKPWMVTANELSAEGHVMMQAAVCAFTCMSVSKTINLPKTTTVDDVKSAYELAWKLGIPGTSLYRDESKPMQVLSALECPSGECGVDVDYDGVSVEPNFDFQTSSMINK